MSIATSSHSQPTTDPLLGSMVAGRYAVQASIGAGAMGTVYRAQQRGLDRPVALKVLRRDIRWGGDTVARFRREAKAMSALTHPNTVRVFDFGTTRDGCLFLAMELLHGKLCTELVRAKAIAPEDAVRFAQQILRSIGEAHSKGIIHRDLKPDNVFLADVDGDSEPVVKVLDFGIAKAIQGEQTLNQFETQDGTVFGTPRYMSPEQAQGKPLDHRSDLYAVGIILYELLTGAPPFTDDDAVVVMAKHIREWPRAMVCPREGHAFSRRLAGVVNRALAKDPDARFQSAWEFELALEACARGGRLYRRTEPGVVAHAAAAAAVAWDGIRAMPARTRWLVAAAALLGLTTGGVLWRVGGAAPSVLDSQPGVSGIVRIDTAPRGAEVFRSGRRIGVTPLDVLVEPSLPSKVLLKKDGFVDLSVQLEANDGQRRFTMARLPAISAGVPDGTGASGTAASKAGAGRAAGAASAAPGEKRASDRQREAKAHAATARAKAKAKAKARRRQRERRRQLRARAGSGAGHQQGKGEASGASPYEKF